MSVPDRLAAALADRYRIEHGLGQGGMATGYLAEDVRHHRKVAIKVPVGPITAVFSVRNSQFMPAPLPGDSEFVAFGGIGDAVGMTAPVVVLVGLQEALARLLAKGRTSK